jgi:protein-disulfide isomerase
MPSIKKAAVKKDVRTLAGDPNAPITVTVYACTRCPFCKVLVPRLYREVTGGGLNGKVNVVFRPFPIKSHEGALAGGLALEAAATLGQFWPFVNLVYARFDAFCPKLLGDWAAESGMDKAAFEKLLNDPQIRTQVVESKQEGIVNKVIATPTLFVNGIEYVYDMSEGVLEDVLEEAYQDTVSKKSNP